MNKWNYESDQTCYCDGTGTYRRGWYAVGRAGYECGTEPERGPYRTQGQAAKAAAKIDADNAAQDAIEDNEMKKHVYQVTVRKNKAFSAETYWEPAKLPKWVREALEEKGWHITETRRNVATLLAKINPEALERAAAETAWASSVAHAFALGAGMARETVKKVVAAAKGNGGLTGE